MRESEARSARFGELLETLMDHPDRDEIIAREMGWDRDDDVDEEDGEDDWRAAAIEAANQPPSEEVVREVEEQHDRLHDIPAYAQGYDWSMRVFHALKGAETGDEDLDELLGEAIGESHVVAVKIAGGHGMGYEDEVLCGNIVRCKRSLEASETSLNALRELADRREDLAETIRPLLDEGEQVRQLVEEHIAELRSQVWWE